MASCTKKEELTKVLVVHKEGYFFNEGYNKDLGKSGWFEWFDKDYTYNVKIGDTYKEEIVSYPKYTLAGYVVWVTVQVDGKEVYNEREKSHSLNIQVK